MLRLEDNETHETLEVDAEAIKADYLEEVAAVPRDVPQATASALASTTSRCTPGCRSTRR